jgi:hypothetical protein
MPPIQRGLPGAAPKSRETPPKSPRNKKIQAAVLTTALETFKKPKCSRMHSSLLLILNFIIKLHKMQAIFSKRIIIADLQCLSPGWNTEFCSLNGPEFSYAAGLG